MARCTRRRILAEIEISLLRPDKERIGSEVARSSFLPDQTTNPVPAGVAINETAGHAYVLGAIA